MPTCSTPDCSRPLHALGLCQACYRRARRAENPEVAEAHRASLRRSYEKKIGRPSRKPSGERRQDQKLRAERARAGIVDATAERREGECPICQQARPLVCDHDHDTGIVRGWLCRSCNAALGALGDSAGAVKRALDYLLQNG